uniref:Uncharacterized protein n=1 Tax=viral metagenome TaxID=1070528 RepID=A0A6M3LWJ6_9ZZZZ
MSAGKNYNIQTVRKVIAAGTVAATRTAIAATVAAGMKRYVTFVRLESNGGATNLGSRVYLVSTTAAGSAVTTAAAQAGLKMMLDLMSNIAQPKVVQLPLRIDTENPLFSIAAGRNLSVMKSGLAMASNPCSLFVQYYDQ